MENAAEIWDQAGYKVVGAAPSGKAAKNLEDSGIASSMMHALAARLEKSWSTAFFEKRSSRCPCLADRRSVVADDPGQQRRARGMGAADRGDRQRARHSDLSEKTRQWVMEEVARVMADPVNKKAVVVIDEAGMAGHAFEQGPAGNGCRCQAGSGW